MQTFIEFTAIPRFPSLVNHIIKTATFTGFDISNNLIYDSSLPKPVLSFFGTCKLHGSFGSIVHSTTDGLWFQAKDRILTILKDNAGFAQFCEGRKDIFLDFISKIRTELNIPDNLGVNICGEWCGKKIQKHVAIKNLDKSFFIFTIQIVDFENENNNYYIRIDNSVIQKLKAPEKRIYNIFDFGTYELTIDFNDINAEEELNELVLKIEEECPVAKSFGFSGLGEGLVLQTTYKDKLLWIKAKGNKHAAKSEKIDLSPVDDEKVNFLISIANQITPGWRLDQMLTKACNLQNGGVIEKKQIGTFIKLVLADIVKEDLHILLENEIEVKQISSYIAEICRNYFFEQIT